MECVNDHVNDQPGETRFRGLNFCSASFTKSLNCFKSEEIVLKLKKNLKICFFYPSVTSGAGIVVVMLKLNYKQLKLARNRQISAIAQDLKWKNTKYLLRDDFTRYMGAATHQYQQLPQRTKMFLRKLHTGQVYMAFRLVSYQY